MALDRIDSGVAYSQALSAVMPSMKCCRMRAATQVEAIRPMAATTRALPMARNLSRSSLSSRAASSTIMIRPMMPRMRRMGKKSRFLKPDESRPSLIRMPSTISISTEGTFVRLATSPKKKEKMMMTEARHDQVIGIYCFPCFRE